MARLFIVDDSATTIANIERAITSNGTHSVVGSAQLSENAFAMMANVQPDAILIDLDMRSGDGLHLIEQVRLATSWVVVIAMSANDDAATISMARNAGAQELLPKPFDRDELFASINSALQHQAAMTPAELERHSLWNRPTNQQGYNGATQVLGVTGAKGGAGASVIAANLAATVAIERKSGVLVVDLNLQHGSVRRLLRTDEQRNIYDVMNGFSTNADAALQQAVVQLPSGISVLLAPEIADLQGHIGHEFITNLIPFLRSRYSVIILDIPSHLDPIAVAAIHAVDRVVLVSSMSDLSIHAALSTLAMYNTLGVAKNNVEIVLNRSEANSEISKSTAERLFGGAVAIQFPYDPILVSTSVNRGVPFVLQKPDSQVARKVRELAARLLPGAVSPGVSAVMMESETQQPVLVPPEPPKKRGKDGKEKKRMFFH